MPMNREKKKLYNQQYYRNVTRKAFNAPKTGQNSDRKVVFSVRLPNSLVGRLHRIMIEAEREGRHVWKNQSHLAQDLLVKGLEATKGLEVVDEAMQYLRVVSPMDSLANHRREAEAAFSRLETELKALLRIKAKEPAIHFYHSMLQQFQAMSSNIWRDWFIDEMQKAFPELHRAKPGKIHLGGDAREAKDKALKIVRMPKQVSRRQGK